MIDAGAPRRGSGPLAWLCIALALLAWCPTGALAGASAEVPDEARGESGFDGREARVEARLLVDAASATADTVRVGVLFELDPDWHLYWRNPGDTGLPTRIEWRMQGARVGPTRWPAPSAFEEGDGLFVTYGYERRVLLASDLSLEAGVPANDTISFQADLLVCKTECIPADFSLERSLAAALVDSPENAATHEVFEEFEARLPRAASELGLELEALYSQSALRPGDAFRAALVVRSCVSEGECVRRRPVEPGTAFFPESSETLTLRSRGVAAGSRSRDTTLLGFEGSVNDDASLLETRLRGVLALRDPSGAIVHADVDLPLPLAPAAAEIVLLGEHWLAADGAAGSLGWLEAVLLALLGGLILNLMPCVLPVLAIKVYSIAELAGRDRRHVIANGAAYALGILGSMGLLAALVIGLRAIGAEVGWGFQFQSPLFVAGISVVLVVFALNLFGVFEISPDVGRAAGLGAQATGARRSFFEGLLAVVLATPCSAPFLGTAVGFAFAGSPASIVAIFLAIGTGLAAPFVLVSLVPSWSRFVPHTGVWMLKLRAGLGFALLATVVWLLWITGGQAGVEGMTALILLLLAISFGLWIYGGLQSSGRAWLRCGVGLALVLLAVVGLGLVRVELSQITSGVAAGAPGQPPAGRWQPWQSARIQAELAEGRTVLVAFSADWCITCKVNERVVLANPRVVAELERLDVRLFKADWTRRDDAIRKELARHGRAGVPLYLVYDPSAPERPRLLPELLSIGDVVEGLREAAKRAAAHAGAAREGRAT